MRHETQSARRGAEQIALANLPRRAPVRYFWLLRDVLHGSGVDTARLLDRAGIDPALFNNRDSMLTSVEVENLILAAKELTGREDLGFETGRRVKINAHNLLGYGLISCPTVDDLLRMGSRHFGLIQENWGMRYRRNSAGAGECTYTPLVAMPQATLVFSLEAIALAHQNHIHHLVGQHLGGYDMYLSISEPAHLQRYELLSPVRFHFDASALPGVRVVMPPAMLELPLALGDEEVMREIDARCSVLGQKPTRGEVTWTDYVTMKLRDARGARITMEDIAQSAQVSARTLDRNLKKEGLGFRALADQVRFERACEMLSVPGVTAVEVAQQLGFSDAPNFNRAFRRVRGLTPGQFQEGKARKR